MLTYQSLIVLYISRMYIIKIDSFVVITLCNSNKEGWDHSPSIWTSLTAVLPVIWDTGPQTYSIHWSVNTKKGKIKNLWITYQFYHLQSLAQHSISSGIWTSYKIDTHIKDLNMVKTVIEWSYSNWNFTWIENIAPIILKNMSPYKVGHFVWYELKI